MGLEQKFEKWSSKVSKGSEEYIAIAYNAKRNVAFHVLDNERLKLEQMYVGVFYKGEMVKVFCYSADVETDSQSYQNVAVIVKGEKEIICKLDESYYSNMDKDNPVEIIILSSSEMLTECTFALPKCIPYVVTDHVTPNGRPECRFRYSKLLIEGVKSYIEKEHGTALLPDIPIDTNMQMCEEETDGEE